MRWCGSATAAEEQEGNCMGMMSKRNVVSFLPVMFDLEHPVPMLNDNRLTRLASVFTMRRIARDGALHLPSI